MNNSPPRTTIPYRSFPTSPSEKKTSSSRIMFLSIGQSPRTEIIDDLISNLDRPIQAKEIGILDGLSSTAIDELRVRSGEKSIVTRLANGSDVVISKRRITERIADVVAGLRAQDFDLVVILSTGINGDFECICPTVNAQRAMESAVISLASYGATVGIILPLQKQIDELDVPALSPYKLCASHAPDGSKVLLQKALLELSEAEIIVLSSVGFTEADREMVAKESGKPVVLVRRIVASAIRLMLHGVPAAAPPDVSPELSQRIERLTPRERQVLSLVTEGHSNKAIARQLSISPKTVEIHRSNMMSKMEATSSNALVRMIVASGYR